MSAATTYLDYNATAPLRAEARVAMEAAMDALAAGGNPSSVHRAGRVARRIVEDARADVAGLAGALPDEIVFTSGGTEANTLAITGTLAAGSVARLVVCATEHASVLETARASGADLSVIGVDADGRIDLAALAENLAADTRPALVCVMASNNETGAIQPVPDVVALVKAAGGRVHVDAIQHAGKCSLAPLVDAHTLALSAHKIGGPQGTGALIARGKATLEPQLRGGGQEMRRRAGTENVIGIAGFGAAARVAAENIPAYVGLADMRDGLENRILAIAAATGHAAAVICPAAERLPNTSCVAFDGVAAETLLMALDLAGICVSSGSACSSGKVAQSHVLQAMGVDPDLARGAIRVSLGWDTTADDIDRFCTGLEQALGRMTSSRGTLRAAGE